MVVRLRLGRPRCLLVIAPHPDDETIGAHGLIALARRRGIAVRIVVVTDGAASHPASRAWPRPRLVRERQRETRRAMRRLGVGAAGVTFLGLPDGELSAVVTAVANAVGRALRLAPRPLVVATPGACDDHPDHRIVAGATRRSPATRRLGYPVWPAGARLPGARALSLTPQLRLAKRRAIVSYRTQAGAITDDPTGFAMTAAQVAAFSRPRETFVELDR